jgi:hypothetical protein
MDCATLQSILDSRRVCEASNLGAKLLTQCLYPSADPVYVHVGSWGDGFRVTDGGGAAESVLVHGRDADAVDVGLYAARDRHSLQIEGGQLVAHVPTKDWLPIAIMAVANGSVHAATVGVDYQSKRAERSLAAKIGKTLQAIVPEKLLAREFEYRGESGKLWHIDYAITLEERPILIKGVTPHHNSISSNYTTFGDLRNKFNRRSCVYQRRPANDDSALLRQVAELVPLAALEGSVQEALRSRI